MAKANTLTGRQSWQLRDWIASQTDVTLRSNNTLATQASSLCGFLVTARNIESALADVGISRPKRERKAAEADAGQLAQVRDDIHAIALALLALTNAANMHGSARAMNEIINR